MTGYNCNHFTREINIVYGTIIPWKEIDKGFWWEKVRSDPLGF